MRVLTNGQLTLDNWPSRIRHFVRASPAYSDLSRCTAPETADLTFSEHDERSLATRFARGAIGDSFTHWLPDWLNDETGSENEPLEWLFEVKTTLGPCSTDFFVSASQYEKVSFDERVHTSFLSKSDRL